jgi:hypothetical protein
MARFPAVAALIAALAAATPAVAASRRLSPTEILLAAIDADDVLKARLAVDAGVGFYAEDDVGEGNTFLTRAIAHGSSGVFQYLLTVPAFRATINKPAVSPFGSKLTPLAFAVNLAASRPAALSAIDHLLATYDEDLGPSLTDELGVGLPFCAALSYNLRPQAEAMLASRWMPAFAAKPCTQGYVGRPLDLALNRAEMAIARRLVEGGPTITDQQMYAILLYRHDLDLAQTAVDRGFDVNTLGGVLVRQVVTVGDEPAIRFLLDHGGIVDPDEQIGLFQALIRNGAAELVERLLATNPGFDQPTEPRFEDQIFAASLYALQKKDFALLERLQARFPGVLEHTYRGYFAFPRSLLTGTLADAEALAYLRERGMSLRDTEAVYALADIELDYPFAAYLTASDANATRHVRTLGDLGVEPNRLVQQAGSDQRTPLGLLLEAIGQYVARGAAVPAYLTERFEWLLAYPRLDVERPYTVGAAERRAFTEACRIATPAIVQAFLALPGLDRTYADGSGVPCRVYVAQRYAATEDPAWLPIYQTLAE